jgi:hypothetical protein
MAEVINLRTARKQAERARARRVAEQNRLAHGRTKAERDLHEAQAERSDRRLDAHLLERKDPE